MLVISSQHSYNNWWRQQRPRLTLCYLTMALALLILSGTDYGRTISKVGNTFGDFLTWWVNHGLLAGMSWLLVGTILLLTAEDWVDGVEGITTLPPAMLLLLSSHAENAQIATPTDLVSQLLWVPSLAMLGAALIHLSLTYRPERLSGPATPRLATDLLPYLPLIALATYEWSTIFLMHRVPVSVNLTASLSYATVGCLISLFIGLRSLIRVGLLFPRISGNQAESIPLPIRQRIGDMTLLWISGVSLGLCLGILPYWLTKQTLVPPATLYILTTLYPLILLYATRSLRRLDRLHGTLAQREVALHEQQRIVEDLRHANRELQQTTSLLLHADAHLRAILSQRIHDQPKQQALRIRSLLGHWQHKLRVEAESDPDGKVVVQPIVDALSKVRKISEELESDLRGLQLLVEDAYQRRSLGIRLHLEKLIREDLPALYSESPLRIQADLWAIDAFNPDLEQTEVGEKIAEAISYVVTQALLNVYHHAGATYATVLTRYNNGLLEVSVIDDGRGFNLKDISSEKASLFKAQLKAREAGGTLLIDSTPRPLPQHGTRITLKIVLPNTKPPLHGVEQRAVSQHQSYSAS